MIAPMPDERRAAPSAPAPPMPTIFVGAGAALLACVAGFLGLYLEYVVADRRALPMSVVVAAVQGGLLQAFASQLGRKYGDPARVVVWIAGGGLALFIAYVAHLALGEALVDRPSPIWVPVVGIGALAVSTAAANIVRRDVARSARGVATAVSALTAVVAILVVAAAIRARKPEPDAYVASLPVVGEVPAAGANVIDLDPLRAGPFELGPLRVTRSPTCNIQVDTASRKGDSVPATCLESRKVRHDATQHLWIFEGPEVDLGAQSGSRAHALYVPHDAFDDRAALRQITPLDVGGSLGPPRGWIAAAAAGCAVALVSLRRGRRAQRRLEDLAGGRPGVHEGDGRIVLDDGTALTHSAAATWPAGPVVVTGVTPEAGYRAAQRVDDVAAGTPQSLRTRAAESLAATSARAVVIVALASAALVAAALDGLVFGDARLELAGDEAGASTK
jgi:hypothetical protein